jgi:CHAT domain-containing protein
LPRSAHLLKRQKALLEDALGRFSDADSDLLEAINIARSNSLEPLAASAAVVRARILLELRRPEEATACLTLARKYTQESGNRRLEPYILHYEGRVLAATNRFEESIAPLKESLDQFEKAKDLKDAAIVSITLATAEYRLGQFEEALRLYQHAQQIAPAADQHFSVGHIGNMFFERGEFQRAADNYLQAAKLAKNQNTDYHALWLSNLSIALIEQQKWNEAERYNAEALAIEKKLASSMGLPFSLVAEARIEAGKGNYAAAEQHLQDFLHSKITDRAATLDGYAALADIYTATKRPDLARRQYATTLKMVDETRGALHEDENKLSYLASLIKLNRKYVSFLMAHNDAEGAFQAAEQSRARILRDRLDVAQQAVQSHTIADYRRAAHASGAAYLAYWVAPERSYLWVVTGKAFAPFTLPGEAEIRAAVEPYQQQKFEPQAGEKLFAMLVAPAAGMLGGEARFVIVPDGPLYGLNFETLRTGGHYWISDATIAVAPSLDLLLRREPARRTSPSVLLVGDAAEWNPSFPKLLNAAKEIDLIAKQFPPARETALTGAEANPSAYVKARPAGFSYIHFAAHAMANRDSPLESAIILSQANGAGKLSVKDVLATPVHADLVTISACSSAGARTYAGEGLVGLAWAFLQSGARGVVAGLWDVSDYSSPKIMEALYAGLAHGERPEDALRAAKLKLLEPGSKYADPYYWGPFQLYLGSR